MTNNIKSKLNKQNRTDLFIKLAKALALLHSPTEMAQLLRDLLSETEVLMLARRLQIAELLVDGLTYDQIRSKLKVGFTTIAKVQTWLDLYGEGYRTIINRSEKKKPTNSSNENFSILKKKYPMYFWPELLLKEIIKAANEREKQKLLKIVEQQREKTQLTKELTLLLKQ